MTNGEGDTVVKIRGESLWLLPERAAFWEKLKLLLVADAHFGKAATFRAAGIPVPGGTTDNALDRLKALVSRTSARGVVFLGDFLHAREGRSQGIVDGLRKWREDHSDLDLTLVRGNHDRHAGDPPDELNVKCANGPWLLPPFALTHHPRKSEEGYVIAGHVHPAVRLHDKGRQHLRLPCFIVGDSTMVLPAFGDFTGLGDVEPAESDQVFVVSGDSVLQITRAP
ncbi:MAG: ligase-associated DNA damage response endonuclease PdeM [Gemmatimonadaceae bacterium]